MSTAPYSYLALGDSYTIGESVSREESFPVQVTQFLHQMGTPVSDPVIIARTGWTAEELLSGINAAAVNGTFDIVTLLIGVNDQYRGRSVESFRPFYRHLLQKAVEFAGHNAKRVIALSIPDWGVTPYALNFQPDKIAIEIDAFNAASREMAFESDITYLDITGSSREAANNPALVAADGLHPSAVEYGRWASALAPVIALQLQ